MEENDYDPMGVFAMRRFILGEAKPGDMETIRNRRAEENYGESETFEIEKVSGKTCKIIHANKDGESKYGGRVEIQHKGERVPYWVTESWCNPGMLRVDEAYRIISEDDKTLVVREVRDLAEIEEIVVGMKEAMRRVLGR